MSEPDIVLWEEGRHGRQNNAPHPRSICILILGTPNSLHSKGELGGRGNQTDLKSKIIWKYLGELSVITVQFSRSVVSDSLRPHESQHARPPCPSPTPGVHSDSCPLSRWCHPAISSSVVPFSSCPQSLPASGSFPMRQLFAWGGQSTGFSHPQLSLL